LKTRYGSGKLADWLSLEIGHLRQRLDWFRGLA
jgi:hypothetical protein